MARASCRGATTTDGGPSEEPSATDGAYETESSGARHFTSTSTTPADGLGLRRPYHTGHVDSGRRLQPAALLLEIGTTRQRRWLARPDRPTLVAYSVGALFSERW